LINPHTLLRSYPAKLLLFGEYTVLNGSQALAVPLHHWKGEWIKGERAVIDKDAPFFTYVDWLRDCHWISDRVADQIKKDVSDGWMYQSEIPIGYGLGSSGAFVAAIFDRYMAKEMEGSQATVLETLADMEGYFHGSSSGMDPMISYTDQAIYKNEQGILHAIKDPGWPEGFHLYLLDSGIGRSTGPLVQEYKEKIKEADFCMKVERQLIPMVDHAIHFYLSGSAEMLEQCIGMISQFQRHYFSNLIPDSVKNQWDELVSHPGVYVKLCGAGGGGYFMVVSKISGLSDVFTDLINVA
jgi:mevalonate kinase